MKNIFFFIAGTFCTTIIYSQSIPNGSFENWSVQNLFSDPNGFTSSNMWTYMASGNGNVKKVADAYHGMFAAKLETVAFGNDTIQGMLLIGTPGNQTVDGGIPFTGTPDSISCYVKRNLLPNDTANFFVLFKGSGTVVGMAAARFTGIASNYSRFVVPVSYFGGSSVDTIAIIISSSNMDPPQFPGSTITIDSISFIGSSQPFPNGSFESWTAVNTEEPNSWATLNFLGVSTGQFSAVKSTDSYDGTYALQLKSVLTPWNDTICFITNGKLGNEGPVSGMPVSANPKKLTGYYKYFPNGPDTALAGLWTYKYDSVNDTSVILDSVVIHLTATNTYTYFEIPLTYNSNPVADTANISFTACNMEDSAFYSGLGSILFIDKLEISYYYPLGEKNISEKNSEVYVYPNPSNGKLEIRNLKLGIGIEIYNLLGKKIYSSTLTSTSISIPTDLSSGIYLYQIITENNEILTGKIAIEK